MNIDDIEKLIAAMPDIVIAVRIHPADFKRLLEATYAAEAKETSEEREWRRRREAAISHFVQLPPLASIPVHVDTAVPEGTPKFVRKSERAEHERWLEARR